MFLYYIVGANCVRPFLICYELAGDRRSPLRSHIKFNLIATESSNIFANSFGGSKPPPYHIVVCFVSFATAFGCLLRIADRGEPCPYGCRSFANDCVEHLIKIARTSSSLSVQFNLFVHFLFFFSLGVFKKFLSYPNSA